ncbi:sensor histidine kinase [Luteolibacter soli]|uniref:histidine kinase n=1 Tax=Luteolibacter soli TaxID=3135280 RepID=A0ABU9AQG3_9BACT
MSRRSSRSWSLHWLTLAVVLPLVVLIALAVAGLNAQAKAAWAAKQEEADRAAKVAADLWAREFERIEVRFPRFPDPPMPGSASPLDAVLEGKDLQALDALSKSPVAGISPAGLPRRAVAALRLLELDSERLSRDPDEGRRIAWLLTKECPSVLTQKALENWFSPGDSPEVEHWRDYAKAASLLETNPAGGWMLEDGDLLWIGPAEDHIAFISCPEADLVFRLIRSSMPPGFNVIPSVGRRGAGSTRPFATAVVPFGSGLKAEVYPTDLGALSDGIIRQQVWSICLLALASGVCLFGLFFFHRTLRRERQLSEMKSQFVASVSHELRAPVASIRLMADALEAEKVAPETAKEFHRLIAREGARLSTLVGNVLDHARIEQGRKVWRMEPCDLTSLVADTVRVMEPLAQERGITLKQELSPAEATADADAIQQALVNLLDNAIKFSPKGSLVVIALASDDERRRWKLSVRDEGAGIPKEEQSRIFERFYRPGDELRRETQGTGIGLSLVKSIVEAHHGSVAVESDPGKGSAFTLTFPLSA